MTGIGISGTNSTGVVRRNFGRNDLVSGWCGMLSGLRPVLGAGVGPNRAVLELELVQMEDE